MLTARCHCGAVQITVSHKPRQLTSCNCSICHRYGTLWAYYRAGSVRLKCRPGALEHYSWGKEWLRFARCRTCGCVTHWSPNGARKDSRMGINARNFEPEAIAAVRIRRLDGASSWKYLD
jgi:hypothetical protein